MARRKRKYNLGVGVGKIKRLSGNPVRYHRLLLHLLDIQILTPKCRLYDPSIKNTILCVSAI